MSNMSDDDLFASLGGSLMKDLLADLAVDDGETGWMSLEELEKELSQLGKGPSAEPPAPLPQPSAASMVVNHQQATGTAATASTSGAAASSTTTTTAGINNPAVDAWSLSFQKFTAASLEQDFLQADSVRKQNHQQQPTDAAVAAPPPGLDLTQAQDYNVEEAPTLAPPPGMQAKKKTQPPAVQQALDKAAADLLQQIQGGVAPTTAAAALSETPIPKPVPATPQNSISFPQGQGPPPPQGQVPPPQLPPPQVPPQMPPGQMSPPGVPPPQGMVGIMPPVVGSPVMPGLPGSPPGPMPGMMMPLGGAHPVVLPPPRIPVAVPVRGGPAWQQPPPPQAMPPPQPPRNLPPRYCNPHPRAPPIPATALASKCMTARDIAYVVHGILRHVQAAGASAVDDYDVQYWVRRNGKAAEQAVVNKNTDADGNKKNPNKTAATREAKAKEWSSEHATLGHVAKTNVARPRALIAQPVKAASDDENESKEGEQKQRAALWKARIYVDQAYQAFHEVMNLWRAAPPEQKVPLEMQVHLLKLFKCMGLTKSGEEYTIADTDALGLLLKLDKGKILLSRVLEQALLPPKAVQAALPVIIQVLLSSSSSANTPPHVEDPVDTRLFLILSRVIESLHELDPQAILQSVQVVVKSPEAFFSSTARMQCVHALLQRGGREAAGGDEAFGKEWSAMEETFMALLAGM